MVQAKVEVDIQTTGSKSGSVSCMMLIDLLGTIMYVEPCCDIQRLIPRSPRASQLDDVASPTARSDGTCRAVGQSVTHLFRLCRRHLATYESSQLCVTIVSLLCVWE